MSKADPKHTEVKRFIGVRALVTTLMLVVDYVIPDGKDDAFIFDAWTKWIQSRWSIVLREQVMRWANQRRLIASDHVVDNPLKKPDCIDRLPFASDSELLVQARVEAFNVLTKPRQRRILEREVLDAVSGLPNFARSVLRDAWSILEGQGNEFDDARLELVGMTFDLANGNKGVDARDLSQYAYHMLDMRLAPMPPKLDNEMASIVRITERPTSLTQTQKEIADECGRISAMLIQKNRAYGDSALDPVRVFSQVDTVEDSTFR